MSKGINIHGNSPFLQMPPPILARLILLCIIVAFAMLLIRHFGIYMRQRHNGQTPW